MRRCLLILRLDSIEPSAFEISFSEESEISKKIWFPKEMKPIREATILRD